MKSDGLSSGRNMWWLTALLCAGGMVALWLSTSASVRAQTDPLRCCEIQGDNPLGPEE